MRRANTNQPFSLAEQVIHPGERAQFTLPSARLFTHTPLDLTVEVVHGDQPGPVLLVCAAVHGNELNGVEIIRRLRTQPILEHLAGTLVLVPVVNLHGFINQSRYLPDRRDLNRCFPGQQTGSLGSRLAHQFFSQVVSACTHIIDLHTGAVHRDNLPQVRGDLSVPEIATMANAFALPVVVNAGLIDNSLRAEATRAGKPVITYEAGEALRLSEQAIVSGVRGIISTMAALNMATPVTPKTTPVEPVVATSTRWIRASHDGIFKARVRLGSRVATGQIMGAIVSPYSAEEVPVVSKVNGIVIGMSHLPLVNAGDALFNTAGFPHPQRVRDSIAAHESRIANDSLFELAQAAEPGQDEEVS